MNIQDRIERYKKIRENISKVPDAIDKIVSDNKDVLLSLNRDQLLFGRNSEGKLLAPKYLQDPYFKTKAQAESYARMKYKMESVHNSRLWVDIQLFPYKPKDTPNLIVTGSFQDGMFILTGKDQYQLGSTYKDTPAIDQKYNGKIFGLADKSKDYFYRYYMRKILKGLIYGL